MRNGLLLENTGSKTNRNSWLNYHNCFLVVLNYQFDNSFNSRNIKEVILSVIISGLNAVQRSCSMVVCGKNWTIIVLYHTERWNDCEQNLLGYWSEELLCFCRMLHTAPRSADHEFGRCWRISHRESHLSGCVHFPQSLWHPPAAHDCSRSYRKSKK